MQILTALALLVPAFSLLYTPQPLALLFLRVYNAPLDVYKRQPSNPKYYPVTDSV